MRDLFYEIREQQILKVQNSLEEISSSSGNRSRFYELAGIDIDDYKLIESNEKRLNTSQYIAIATVIDRESKNNPYFQKSINRILGKSESNSINLVDDFYCLFEKTETNIGEDDTYYLKQISEGSIVLCESAIHLVGKDETFGKLLKRLKGTHSKIILPASTLESVKGKLFSTDIRDREKLRAKENLSVMNNMLRNELLAINNCQNILSEDEEIMMIFEESNKDKLFTVVTQSVRFAESIKNSIYKKFGVEIRTITLMPQSLAQASETKK